MKNTLQIIVLASMVLLAMTGLPYKAVSQTIYVEVDPYDMGAVEVDYQADCNLHPGYGNSCTCCGRGPENTDCDDCSIGGPVDMDVTAMWECGGNYSVNHFLEDRGCGWQSFNYPSAGGTTYGWSVNYAENIQVRISGAEDDIIFCTGNDGECSPSPYTSSWNSLPNANSTYNQNYGTTTSTNSIQINGNRCPYSWSGLHYSNIENCASDNSTNDYRVRWQYRYHFVNGMTAGTIDGGDVSACGSYDRGQINAGGWTSCNIGNYQWQESINYGAWTNISGATGTSYNPPNRGPGTYQYRFGTNYYTNFSGGQTWVWSNVRSDYIYATPSATVIPSATQVCTGTNVNFNTSFGVGGFVRYQYNWNGNSGWNNWGTTQSYNWTAGNPGNTLWVRAEISNGSCTGYYTSPVYIQVDAPSNVGSYNLGSPIVTCDNAGNIAQLSVSGYTGAVTWQWGSANGAWNWWVGGANAGTCCFPVNPGLTGADRIRATVTNGACATAYGSVVLIQNHNSPNPTSLTANINNVCPGSAVTLTANFPYGSNTTANVISDYSQVQFYSESCGGTLLGTVNHSGGVASIVVNPTVATTYYARSTSSCETSACASVTVNMETSAPSVSAPSNYSLVNGPNNSCQGALILSDPGVTDNCSSPSGTENILPSSGLVLWTRGDAGVLLDQSGNVKQWTDLSGNGNHISQNTPGNRPTYVAGQINGEPVVRFNTAQFMTTSTSFNNPYSIFTITKMNNGTDRRLISSANVNWLMGNWGGAQNVMYANGWVAGSGGPTPDNLPHMYAATGTGSNTTFYDFGSVIASNANGTAAPGQLQLNSWSNGTGESSDGDVAEVIIYNRVLSNVERQRVEGYLAYKYNLKAPLASMVEAQSYALGNTTAYYQGADASGNIGSASNTVTVSSYPGPTVTPSETSVCTGGNITLDITGMAPGGQVLNCTGNGYLNVPNVPIGSNWTIETWFQYPFPTGSWNTMIRGTSYHHIIVDRSSWELGTYVSGFRTSGFNMTQLSNGWHHMAAVGTGGSTAFYIDGVKVGVSAGYQATDPIVAVGNYQGGNQPFGKIDEVRIWNTAVNQKEINNYMTREITASHPNWANMVAYYKMNNNGNDSKGSYNGTVQSGAPFVDADYYTYVWSGPAGSTFTPNNSTTQSTVAGVVNSGNYNVYATANGCASSTTTTVLTAVADPSAPTITKSPNTATVCDGATLTVTISGGTGGLGTCVNQYRYSTNNGSTWSSWSASVPSFAAVIGTNLIESRRDCNGNGCNSNVNQVSWSVVADPVAPTMTKSPNVASVCQNTTLTVTPAGGSGGTGTCNSEYRYSTNGGSTWTSWSTSVPSFAAVTGTNIVESRRNCTGSGCASNVNSVSWSVVPDAVAPAIQRSPNVDDVCEGVTLTITVLAPGSGGTGTCNDEYRFSTNSGSTWSSWSTTIPSWTAVTGINLVESRRSCCNSSVIQLSWNVVADPVAPTMTKSPNTATVCEGQTLTVTPSGGGSGGFGTCNNEYRYSTNNGSTWSSWSTSIPSFAAVTGTNLVESRRECSGSGCNSNVNQVSWSVVADPVAPTITKSPNTATVCAGQTLTVTPAGGSGGTGTCNNEYRYSTNGGVSWSSWSTSVPSFAAAIGVNLVESRRECTGSGCNSNVNQVSWTGVATGVAPVIAKSPNEATVCAGATLTVTVTVPGTGGTGTCNDEFRYSTNNGSTWSSWSTTIPSFAAVVGTNLVESRRNCDGAGCGSTVNQVSWSVIADPIAPTITKNPNVASVCAGATLTVTNTGGSGGTGTCDNEYRYSTNNGSTWTAWSGTIPNFTAVTGTNLVESRRVCSGSGCESNYNQVSWTVIADQVLPTLNTATPASGSSICLGADVSATFNAGSGGIGCTDSYQYTVNAGVNWFAYTPGTPITSTNFGVNVVQVRAFRNCSGSGCDNSGPVTLAFWTVYTPTAVSLTLGTDEVCVDVTTVPLTGGTPAGGSWSGPGVIGSDFFPGSVGAGTYTITYSYTDGNGCTNSATDDITVHDLPTVSLNLVTNEACEDATSVALSGGNPAGGTWSGTGVSGSTFNPNAAGSGNHTITYTYTDGNNCTASATDVFTVNPLPTVSLTLADDVACLSDVPFNLSGASPAGGTWSGTGITNGANGTFDPSVAGVGNHTITYTYTDGNGCTDAATDVMEVRGAPTVNFTLGQDVICVNASAIALSGGSGAPAGGSGSYSGPGVSLGNFDPAVAGVGVHTITYTYTDNAGCTNSATDDMTVQSISSAPTSLTAPTAVCSGSPVTLTANGGTPGHGAVYEWATNPGFTGSTTTAGNTYNVVVNSTTTWYVRLTGTCNTTAAVSATVSVSQPSALVHLVDNGDVYGFDGAVLTEICEDGNGFTYYSIVGQYDKYIFAINWDPLNTGGGHNSAAKASAVPYITVDATYTAAISTPASACEATWSMRRYWNVTSDPLDGPVLVRFYYDMAESNAIITAKNNHMTTYGCDDEGVDWFKVPGTFDPSVDMSPVNPIGAQYLFNSNSGALTDNSVLYAELLVNGFSGGTQATGTGPLGNPLPVELVSFTATALDRSIMLDWTTLSEVNNEKFEILKSIDGLSFIAIDEVPGNGTTSDPHDYSYEDRDVEPGVVYYYRLRQVDYDGTSELSSIVSAVISGSLQFAIGEFVPNPTTNFTAIDITVPADEVIGITIYDVLGKEVYRANQLLEKGQNTIDLDVAEFKQGAYIATFSSGFAGVYSKKFTVVK